MYDSNFRLFVFDKILQKAYIGRRVNTIIVLPVKEGFLYKSQPIL